VDRVQEVQDADGEADLRRPDGAPGGSDWVGWAAGMEAAGRRPEWRGGRRPEGCARAARNATSVRRVVSPGGGGQWGWRARSEALGLCCRTCGPGHGGGGGSAGRGL